MAESTPPVSHTLQGSLIQLKKKLISTSGNSILIRKGTDANITREVQIFPKSKIRFLLPIGEKSGEKAFVLAIAPKRIAVFQLRKNAPIAIFKFDDEIVDHGVMNVLTLERVEDEDGTEFVVRLIIPLAFRSGTLRKIRITVHFRESQVIKQNLKCLAELIMDDEELQSCVDLGNNNVFGFYEDTVVKSDGTVTRAGEPSTKKKRRISVVARQLWHGNMLLATENGSIRVVRVKEMNKKSDSLLIFSEGQCVPPYCTLRCRQPSVVISTEKNVFVGTLKGEVHCLNERLKLTWKLETEGGPINCIKIDENDSDFLCMGYSSGEIKRITWMAHDQNVSISGEEVKVPVKIGGRRPDSGPSKRSETELECLEKGCYFRTRVAVTFIAHLRRIHNTSLPLAGLALLCQCGNESISDTHSRLCSISNFSLIRKHDFGPIRTLADKKTTPQCTLCQMYPRTIYGYAYHLYIVHYKSLDEIGCYLKCGVCKADCFSKDHSEKHSKRCKSRFYSLLKLGEEAEKKDETEMDQTVDVERMDETCSLAPHLLIDDDNQDTKCNISDKPRKMKTEVKKEDEEMDETWSLAPLLLMEDNNRDVKKVKQEYESVL